MTDTCNIPIQVISVCGTDGRMQPLRFRYEDEEKKLHTVRILEVLDTRNVHYVGIESFRFLCKAEEDGMGRLFELNYAFRSHRWTISRVLY